MSVSQRAFLHLLLVIQQSGSLNWLWPWFEIPQSAFLTFLPLPLIFTKVENCSTLLIGENWIPTQSRIQLLWLFFLRAHPDNFPTICSPLPYSFADLSAGNNHCLTEPAWQSELFLFKLCSSPSLKCHSLQGCLGGRKENCSMFLISMLFTVGNILSMDIDPREAIWFLVLMLWNLNPKGQSRYY